MTGTGASSAQVTTAININLLTKFRSFSRIYTRPPQPEIRHEWSRKSESTDSTANVLRFGEYREKT